MCDGYDEKTTARKTRSETQRLVSIYILKALRLCGQSVRPPHVIDVHGCERSEPGEGASESQTGGSFL